MGRPRSANPGKTLTLYLRGSHLAALRRHHPNPADAIRLLIERAASDAPCLPPSGEAFDDDKPLPPTRCDRCILLGPVRNCPDCAEIQRGLSPPPPALAPPARPALKPDRCSRCIRLALRRPDCPDCAQVRAGLACPSCGRPYGPEPARPPAGPAAGDSRSAGTAAGGQAPAN